MQRSFTFFNTGLFAALVVFCISLGFVSCNSAVEHKDFKKNTFVAIAKIDTATLKLFVNEKEFYGQFEIQYDQLYKDSGDVNGIIKGDTLLGTYHYQRYGMETWHRIPIALLKKNDSLIMGEAPMVIIMNSTYFKKSVPIDYVGSKFMFAKMNAK